MSAPTFSSDSNVTFPGESVEEGTPLVNNSEENGSSKKTTGYTTWITVGAVVVMCLLGSAAYIASEPTTVTVNQPSNQKSSMQSKKTPASASKPVQAVPTQSKDWQDVSVAEHKKEQAAKHAQKETKWAESGEGAEKRKVHLIAIR